VTELIWDGKYKDGKKQGPVRIALPFQTIETVKESVRAKLRRMVKRILHKYGYPPDKQEKATETVLEQAELLCNQ